LKAAQNNTFHLSWREILLRPAAATNHRVVRDLRPWKTFGKNPGGAQLPSQEGTIGRSSANRIDLTSARGHQIVAEHKICDFRPICTGAYAEQNIGSKCRIVVNRDIMQRRDLSDYLRKDAVALQFCRLNIFENIVVNTIP